MFHGVSARAALVLALASMPAAAVAAPAEAASTEVASTEARELAAIREALEARPLDCDVLKGEFLRLVKAGRQVGDVEAVVLARRTGVPCAEAAANEAAKALGIPQAEVVTWVLAHPETHPAVDAGVLETQEEELGVPLPCGLLFIARRFDFDPGGSRLVLTLKNKTDQVINGHDIVVKVNGQPWRSLVLPKGDELDQPPLGAAEMLQWDPSGSGWTDRRMTESKTLSFGGNKDPRPMKGPVAPGGVFDIVARVERLPPDTKVEDLTIVFETCTLR